MGWSLQLAHNNYLFKFFPSLPRFHLRCCTTPLCWSMQIC
jgi:hypothetical protein